MSPAFNESHPGVPAGVQGAGPWTPRLRFGTESLLTCTRPSCNCPLLKSNSSGVQVRSPSCNLSGAAEPRLCWVSPPCSLAGAPLTACSLVSPTGPRRIDCVSFVFVSPVLEQCLPQIHAQKTAFGFLWLKSSILQYTVTN